MSQTSASEPPIMAKTVAVLDNTVKQTSHCNGKGEQGTGQTKLLVLSTSTISETSEHSSSLLWTPQAFPEHSKRSNTRRSHRQKHKNGRRLWDEKEVGNASEETSPFLSAQGQQTYFLTPNDLCSFERDYHHSRDKMARHSRKNSEKDGSRGSQGHKKHRELYNDYTKYHYHRRSRRDKHRKQSSTRHRKDETQASASEKTGFPKLIQRIKDFFLGKKEEGGERHGEKEPKKHGKSKFQEFSRSERQRRHETSGKLFRSASESDLEVMKHHERHNKHRSKVQDDLCKNGRHWRTKRLRNEKLSSIYESSDKTELRGSGSDGRLVLAKSGSTTYNDIEYDFRHKDSKHKGVKRRGRYSRKEETGTSDVSHSQELSKSKGHHVRRGKDYHNLRKKWAKQHQSFENDLEKLERLVDLVNRKKSASRLRQKASEESAFLERLEAKQEKCVAEVDFTRHVLVCKLQRLENKLEESLSAFDSTNNDQDERRKGLEDIREEMSKECNDLRKLLQETSDQLKEVLEEKRAMTADHRVKTLEHSRLRIKQESSSQQRSTHKQAKEAEGLHRNVPFPELSHHPLNQGHTARLRETKP